MVCLVFGGGLWSAWSWGGGLPGQWGVLPAGGVVCLVRGGGVLPAGGVPPCPETPPVNRITHTCKNKTLATTSLWSVKMKRIGPGRGARLYTPISTNGM